MERLETSLRFIGCEPLHSGLKARLNPAQGNALGYGIRRKFSPSLQLFPNPAPAGLGKSCREGGRIARASHPQGAAPLRVALPSSWVDLPLRGAKNCADITPPGCRSASLYPGLTCPFGAQRIARASHPQGAAPLRVALPSSWVNLPLRGAEDCAGITPPGCRSASRRSALQLG